MSYGAQSVRTITTPNRIRRQVENYAKKAMWQVFTRILPTGIYESMLQVLQARADVAPISLKALAKDVGGMDPAMECAAFRVFYGLFRSSALKCVLTGEAFNPDVIGVDVLPEELDQHFVLNTLSVFRKSSSDLPFDAVAWSLVMYGDESLAWMLGVSEGVHNTLERNLSACTFPSWKIESTSEVVFQ